MIRSTTSTRALLFLPLALLLFVPKPAFADGDVHKVKHVIVIMQENHSFDNYFGALAYPQAAPTTTNSGAVGKTTTTASTA
jgi:phospholipase C